MRTAKDHRPAILEAAARLFRQKRFHEVLMEDVAGAAGVAKGTIYRFYRTKEALLAATCWISLDELAGDLARVAEQPEGARQRLFQMLECVARHFRQHSDSFEVMQREWARACLQKGSRLSLYRAKLRGIFAKVIRDGQAAGGFRAVDAGPAAEMLMGMNRNMLYFGDPHLSPARVAGLILDVFLGGIARSEGKNT
ncbi:MAG: TetR/AcrR family transcriptional regulator [Planctomycetota bacterium]